MLMDYGLSEADANRVFRNVFGHAEGVWHEFDLGLVTPDEVVERYSEMFPEDREVIDYFVHHGEYMQVPRPEIWKRVHQLREKGYNIYLLSNYPEELFRKHTEYADFMQDLDGMMVSYMIHEGKPDPVIYLALCDKYNLAPKDCLFLDDRAENVEGGIRIGMQSLQVTSRAQLAELLDALLEN